MTTSRTTITLADEVLRAVRIRAARQGQRDSQVIEAALREALGLDLLDEIWDTATLDPDDAMSLALQAQDAVRSDRT